MISTLLLNNTNLQNTYENQISCEAIYNVVKSNNINFKCSYYNYKKNSWKKQEKKRKKKTLKTDLIISYLLRG